MSTKTAFSARSNSSRSSIRPLSEFQLARLPLSLSLSLSLSVLRYDNNMLLPACPEGMERGKKWKKKKEWKKLLRVSLKKQMLRVCGLVNIFVKKKKKKERVSIFVKL